MKFLWRRQRDERGAILIMATVGVVLAVISATLAIDLGRIAQERRRDQKVADLAALDALRELGNGAAAIQAAAEASAARNDLPDEFSILAVEGNKVDGSCVEQAGSGSVCVTVVTHITNAFQPGGRDIKAVAVAGRQNKGSFSIGSSLASLDTENSVLDQFIGRWVGGSVNVVSYNGLATSSVTLQALRQELLDMDYEVGTVDELLNTDIAFADLLTAAANAAGDETVAADINNIAAAVDTDLFVKLSNLITVAQGSENAALATEFNVFRLITGSAAVANGTNTISVPSLTISIPGLTSVNVSLKVTEPPKIYVGPTTAPTPHAQTSQVELTITPSIDVNVALAGQVVVAIPIAVEAAKATGNLAAVTCGSPTGITVNATTGAAEVDASVAADVRLLGILGLGPLLNDVLNLSISGDAGSGTHDGLEFEYDADYGPPGTHVGSTTAGLGTLLTGNSGNGLVNAVLGLLLGGLRPVLNAVDNRILRPILRAVGADIGTADIIALPVDVDGTEAGAWCGDVELKA